MAGILNAQNNIAASFPALDQYGPNTTLLLHGDGTNGAQNNTFLDSSTNNFTITRNGNTTQGTFSPFSQPDGYWSNYFNNSGYLYNGSATSVANFGTGNYTIEAWFYYVASTGTFQFIFDASTPGSSSVNIRLLMNASNQIAIYNPSSAVYTSGTTIVSNTWYHIAVCRGGTGSNQSALFINGARDGTFTDSSNYVGGVCCVGACSNNPLGINPLYGYISNLRVVKGTDVYGYSNPSITVPTSPLTAVTNTTLLTCQSNRFVDNSASPVTLTVTGTPAVQSFHPISAPTSYFPSVNGGGAYFDGSGDYLNAGSNAAFAFGTGAYTVEMWVYPFSISQQIYMINDSTGGSGFYFETNSSAGFSIIPRGGGSGLTGGYSSLIINSWNHIVFSRASTSSNQTSIFVNGARVANGTDSNNWTVTGPCSIGGFSPGSYMLNGHMSQVRLVKGTDVYGYSNTTITVPTAPLAAIANTSLLLSCTNGGIFDSVSQNALETVGNAQVSTTQSKFGGASMYFDGSASYVSFINNPINVLGDFTVEGWFYSATATSAFQAILGFGGNPSLNSLSSIAFFLGNDSGGAGAGSSVRLLCSTNGSSWALDSTSSSGITSNSTWHHFAIVRNGGTFTVYINGNAVITSTSIAATTSLYAGTVNRVGSYAYNLFYFSGYIDDLRVTKGVARYTQNFTPPQNAFPNFGPLTNIPTVDPNFRNTTLLLHGNGTNGAQNNTFLDSSTNNFTITRNGNTTQGTFTPFSQPNGWWSNYFNGSSDYLSIANNAAFNLGTGDFTIEAWIYPLSVNGGNANPVISQLTGASNTGWLFGTSSTSLWQFSTGSNVIVRAGTVSLNQWTHLAAVRISGTTTLYVNGSSVGSTSSSFNFTDTASLIIGYQSSFVYANCYVSNARVIKGTGYYTANFTPSTLPLTAVTNTSLLTCQSNRFLDNSTNAFTVTPSGTPSTQNFYPVFPPLDYSTAAIGGSAYFDGSGDQLNAPVSAISSVGSSNFSFECWVYALRQTNTFAQGLISYGPAGVTSTSSCISFQLTSSGYLASTYAAGDSILLTDPVLFTINQWTHCVVCRSGSTISLFKNGVRVATSSTSATIGSGGDTLAIGGQWYANASTRQLQGYMAGIRILNGSSAYDATQSTITIPTTPLTAITNTSLLLSATNGGIFDNSSKNTFETISNAQISTAQSKFGGSSMYFNGSSYIIASPSQPSAFGTSNFTVEYWIYFNSTSASRGTLIVGSGSSGYDALFGWMNASGGPFTLYLSSNNSSWDIANNLTIIPATISTGQWYHVAITRNGSTFKTFCNGNQVSTATSSASIYQTDNRVVIGKYQGGAAYYIDAYINDVRITNGVSRYNTNFTPPAAPFPNK